MPLHLGQPADQVKVFDLVEHLRKAFDQFFENEATFEKPVVYTRVDILMSAHNFHKLIVHSLCEEMVPQERAIFLEIASTTFTMAMNEERKKCGL